VVDGEFIAAMADAVTGRARTSIEVRSVLVEATAMVATSPFAVVGVDLNHTCSFGGGGAPNEFVVVVTTSTFSAIVFEFGSSAKAGTFGIADFLGFLKSL